MPTSTVIIQPGFQVGYQLNPLVACHLPVGVDRLLSVLLTVVHMVVVFCIGDFRTSSAWRGRTQYIEERHSHNRYGANAILLYKGDVW